MANYTSECLQLYPRRLTLLLLFFLKYILGVFWRVQVVEPSQLETAQLKIDPLKVPASVFSGVFPLFEGFFLQKKKSFRDSQLKENITKTIAD